MKDFIDKVNAEEGETVLRRDEGKEKVYEGEVTSPEKVPVNVNVSTPETVSASEAEVKVAPENIPEPPKREAAEITVSDPEKPEGAYTEEPVPQAENVDISEKNGIIEEKTEETAETDVHELGKIDIEKYKCITEDITTDEVIITENQVTHIKNRHPNDYERYFQYAKEIIDDPDYILRAGKGHENDTAFILKHIIDNEKNYQLILRLKTSNDPNNYKNSVITFLKISDKTWRKYLRNKEILYDKSQNLDKDE